MDGVRFFIEFGKEIVQLPVNPEKLKISYPGKNETLDIIGVGEINLLKTPALMEISFESFFPQSADAPYVLTKGRFKDPLYYLNFITGIKRSKQPCRLIITGLFMNTLFSIESFDVNYEAGDEDAYYSISFKRFKEYKVKKIVIPKPPENNTPPQPVKTQTQPDRPNTAKIPTIGCEVVVNGRVHRDSYGKGPGKTLKDYYGKISHINKKGSHPYHVTNKNGGWLGWVLSDAVKVL